MSEMLIRCEWKGTTELVSGNEMEEEAYCYWNEDGYCVNPRVCNLMDCVHSGYAEFV